MKLRKILVVAGLFFALSVAAQEHIEKKYSLFFRVSRSDIDSTYMDNGHTIRTMIDDIKTTLEVQGAVPDSLLIYASSSPEGPSALNQRLAIRRAENARVLLIDLFPQFDPKNIRVESRPNDWSGVILAIRRDSSIINRNALLKVLTDPGVKDKTAALRAIPEAYDEIRHGLLNYMRTATVTIQVIGKKDEFSDIGPRPLIPALSSVKAPAIEPPMDEPLSMPQAVQDIRKPFYMAVKTNMLYDLALVPNIGLEFYLGKNISVAGNWMYSWWKNDRIAWYWRTYGGDLAVRYWFGPDAEKKPLSGHHVGVYGQIITYDFETGGRGYLGDRWSYAGGIEYGYSLPVARRLNIDFNLGVGYLGGEFKEYLPIDGHYVWQATKKRNYIGPTKLEVSLVWLLGYGNHNEGKGGRR